MNATETETKPSAPDAAPQSTAISISVQDHANSGSTANSPVSPRSPTGPVRKNGLETPYSSDQLIACCGHTLSAICVYVVAAVFLTHKETEKSEGLKTLTIVMLSLHVPSMILIVASWISCESIDPSRPAEETLPNGWLGYKLKGPRWEKTRYCAVCRKAVPGLDHHCTWLQTCVGKTNYAQFFTIAVTGTIQFLSQALYASFVLVWLELPFAPASDITYVMQGLLLVVLLISVPCTLMYFILLGFHVYLHFLGYGTYEWMLRRRRKQRARAAEAAAARGEAISESQSKRSSASRTTRRDTDLSDSRASSVGSSSEFMSADEPPRQRQLTAL